MAAKPFRLASGNHCCATANGGSGARVVPDASSGKQSLARKAVVPDASSGTLVQSRKLPWRRLSCTHNAQRCTLGLGDAVATTKLWEIMYTTDVKWAGWFVARRPNALKTGGHRTWSPTKKKGWGRVDYRPGLLPRRSAKDYHSNVATVH